MLSRSAYNNTIVLMPPLVSDNKFILEIISRLDECFYEYSKNITKTVLVTGSSKGIGKQIAQDFEKNGHTVIYHGSSNSSFEKFNCKKQYLI